jgi:hypothetical protein
MGANDEDGEADSDVGDIRAEWDRHRRAIHDLVEDYREENDIGDGAASMMLMTLGLNMRMTAYALDVEKPSASGLKLDLDRFKRDIDGLFREARKNAETFVETAKSLIEKAAREGDTADDEDDDT